MFWLKRLFGQAPVINQHRWVVLDVETSGLDPRRDRLLAIAAVCIHLNEGQSLKIDIFDSFEAVLKQDLASDKDNILLHGIGAQAQMMGENPQQVLRNFERWVGDAPLFAFHAAFDESMIQRLRVFPAKNSSIPSAASLSSFPAEMSRSICASHSAASNDRNHSRKTAKSSRPNCSTALSNDETV
jgi:hypothetical protein